MNFFTLIPQDMAMNVFTLSWEEITVDGVYPKAVQAAIDYLNHNAIPYKIVRVIKEVEFMGGQTSRITRIYIPASFCLEISETTKLVDAIISEEIDRREGWIWP